MKLNNELLRFLYLVRLSYQTQRRFIFVRIHRRDILQFIHQLYKWGFIYSFSCLGNFNVVVVELLYSRQQALMFNMHFFVYNGSFPYISYKVLLRICSCENVGLYILYTKRGILRDIDAIRLCMGGFLLCHFQ